jgi:hypothetical protein
MMRELAGVSMFGNAGPRAKFHLPHEPCMIAPS